jgi:hypothetical protein
MSDRLANTDKKYRQPRKQEQKTSSQLKVKSFLNSGTFFRNILKTTLKS